MRSLVKLAILVSVLFLIPLVALGQDVTSPVADDTGVVLSAATLVAIGIKLLVDMIRKALKQIDGIGVNLLAVALSYGATYISQVGTFTDWASRLNVAIGLAGASSVVAEIVMLLKARRNGAVV